MDMDTTYLLNQIEKYLTEQGELIESGYRTAGVGEDFIREPA